MKPGNSKREIKLGKDSGRVKAYVRVRPFNKDENQRKEELSLKITTETAQISLADRARSDKTFQFDHVFPPNKTNDDVSAHLCKPLVNAALSGFNGTLMAYGQTGTGKTHTLMASDGITTNVVNRCFERIIQDKEKDYKVKVSYLQIYQEKIYDLLNASNKIELCLRESPQTGVYVENLTEYVVRTPSEVQTLIATGRRRLVFAETKMNRTSSRSHAVFQMTIERTLKKEKKEGKQEHIAEAEKTKQTGKQAARRHSIDEQVDESYTLDVAGFDNDVLVRGKIHLCDLAGSERLKKTQASGERLTEAQHINSSLLELGNVIQALADEKKTHIPFRNSVLTRLLQESLGGNCKTSLVVCVSPSFRDISETKSTLHFGSRAMKITNTAYINMEVDFKSLSDSLLIQLQQKDEEISKLKESIDAKVAKVREELLFAAEQTSRESEKILKQQKKLFDDETKALEEKLDVSQSEVTSRDQIIREQKSQLSKDKINKVREEHQAKLMLMSEALSMKILAAVECRSLDSTFRGIGSRERKRLVLCLLEHCKCLVAFTRIYLRYQKGLMLGNTNHGESSTNVSELRDNIGVSDILAEDLTILRSSNLTEDMSQQELDSLKTDLLQTKNDLDDALNQTLLKHGVINREDELPTSPLKEDTSSPVLALCRVLIDKSMLSCLIAIEKLELKAKVKALETKLQNVIVFGYDSDDEMYEQDVSTDLDSTVSSNSSKRSRPVESEDKILGFEFALSRIEKLLFENASQTEIKASTVESACSCNNLKTDRTSHKHTVENTAFTNEELETIPTSEKPQIIESPEAQVANESPNAFDETDAGPMPSTVPRPVSIETSLDGTLRSNFSLDVESELRIVMTENAELKEENMKLRNEIQDMKNLLQTRNDRKTSDLERRTIYQYSSNNQQMYHGGDSQRRHLLGNGRRNIRLELEEYTSMYSELNKDSAMGFKNPAVRAHSVCTQTKDQSSIETNDKFTQVDIEVSDDDLCQHCGILHERVDNVKVCKQMPRPLTKQGHQSKHELTLSESSTVSKLESVDLSSQLINTSCSCRPQTNCCLRAKRSESPGEVREADMKDETTQTVTDSTDDNATSMKSDLGCLINEIDMHDEIDDMTEILDQLIELDKGMYDLKDKMAGNRLTYGQTPSNSEANRQRTHSTNGNHGVEKNIKVTRQRSEGGGQGILCESCRGPVNKTARSTGRAGSGNANRRLISQEITKATEEIERLQKDKADFVANLANLQVENAKLYAALQNRYVSQRLPQDSHLMNDQSIATERYHNARNVNTDNANLNSLMLSNVLHVYTPCMNVIPGQFNNMNYHTANPNEMQLAKAKSCSGCSATPSFSEVHVSNDRPLPIMDRVDGEVSIKGRNESITANAIEDGNVMGTQHATVQEADRINGTINAVNNEDELNSLKPLKLADKTVLSDCEVNERSGSEIDKPRSKRVLGSPNYDSNTLSKIPVDASASCGNKSRVLESDQKSPSTDSEKLIVDKMEGCNDNDLNRDLEQSMEIVSEKNGNDDTQSVHSISNGRDPVDDSIQLATDADMEGLSVRFASPSSGYHEAVSLSGKSDILNQVTADDSESSYVPKTVELLPIDPLTEKEEVVFTKPWSLRGLFSKKKADRMNPDNVTAVLQ